MVLLLDLSLHPWKRHSIIFISFKEKPRKEVDWLIFFFDFFFFNSDGHQLPHISLVPVLAKAVFPCHYFVEFRLRVSVKNLEKMVIVTDAVSKMLNSNIKSW